MTIHNASDWKGPEWSVKIDEEDKVLLDYDLEYQRIDLRNYNNDTKSLEKLIRQSDAVFIGGGNSFLLRYWLQRSGIDNILVNEAKNGLLVGGGSAGAIVLSPSLKHFDLADDPKLATEIIWDGLGLADFEPLVHADSEKYGSIIQTIKRSLGKEDVNSIEINDNQVVVVDSKRVKLI